MSNLPDQITIEVTQEDIDNGERRDASACPITLAASRVLQHGEVRTYEAIYPGRLYYRAKYVAAEIVPFITNFDELGRSAVQPITFVAKLYEEAQ